ncbi:putative TIM-barrel fold metal-dependent hydrolase [Pseudomonas sp. BT76 TE3572]|uniref:amidohydrolase family protein n=1 Tax=Pseudomonas sp. BT76 TE3572 TaxID=3349325 RepID=UPI003D1DC27D
MKRRDLMLLVSASTVIAACDPITRLVSPASNRQRPPLIDVHAHVFNASDLPTVRFIKIVFLKHYPKQAISVLNVDDPDAMDQLVQLFTYLVGSTRAPTAFEEVKVLDNEQKLVAANADPAENDKAMIRALAVFTQDQGVAVSGDGSSINLDKIKRAIREAGKSNQISVSSESLNEADAATVMASNAYYSFDLGLVLRWFGLFTRYRYSLAEQLARDHEKQGFTVSLICPALVDYDHWLGEYVKGKYASPLPDQVIAMGRISRRKTGPTVHGYVGFDPLRQVAFDAGIFKDYNPLALVRKALREEGFLGVKLYPPMGFRAMGNADPCQTYPGEKSRVVKQLLALAPDDTATTVQCKPRPLRGSQTLGRHLDSAMARLFDECVKEDGVVLAHTNDSNGSNVGFSHRADPYYWIEVFERWPTLHVALAHFGSFNAESAGKPLGASGAEASWEWTLGRFLKSNPNAPVFSDISYLVEIVGRNPSDQDKYDKVVRSWVSTFDPECRHLMFGTDWMMLGLDKSYEGYTEQIYGYFKNRIGFSQPMLDRLFAGNAGTFLGLRKNDRVRERLLQFYRRYQIPENRLPEISVT